MKNIELFRAISAIAYWIGREAETEEESRLAYAIQNMADAWVDSSIPPVNAAGTEPQS